jgi:hypothetical protein
LWIDLIQSVEDGDGFLIVDPDQYYKTPRKSVAGQAGGVASVDIREEAFGSSNPRANVKQT